MKRPVHRWRQTARKWRQPDGKFLASRTTLTLLRMVMWGNRYQRGYSRNYAKRHGTVVPW